MIEALKNTALEALNDNVLIELCEVESTTKGGIIIPDSYKKKSDKAVVISVGDNVKDKKIKEGATVYAIQGATSKTPIMDEESGKTYFLLKDYDLLAHIPKR